MKCQRFRENMEMLRLNKGTRERSSTWERENVNEINEYDEAVFDPSRELLSKDVLSREMNFNNICAML